MNKVITIYLSIVFLFLVLSPITFPQEITGNIEGRVRDSTGNPMQGINITVFSKSLQGSKGTTTNDLGYFRVLSLPIGDYNLRISTVGYNSIIIKDVKVHLGKTTSIGEVKLKQQPISLAEITVSGEKPVIDPSSTSYGGDIHSEDFEHLPVDRNYRSIITLLPQSDLAEVFLVLYI